MIEVWKCDSGKSRSTRELSDVLVTKERVSEFNRGTLLKESWAEWLSLLSLSSFRPSSEAPLHSRHDLFLLLTTEATFSHKDKDTDTETMPRLGCTVWVSAQRQRWWCMNTCQQLNRHFTWWQCVCSAGQHKQALFCRHNERNVTSNCLLDAPYVIISSYIPSTHKNKTRNAQHGLYL